LDGLSVIYNLISQVPTALFLAEPRGAWVTHGGGRYCALRGHKVYTDSLVRVPYQVTKGGKHSKHLIINYSLFTKDI